MNKPSKAYWGNDNKFVDVFLPNSKTEVIRFWNNTHPVKELTDEEITEVVSLFLKVQFQLNNPSPVFDYKGFAKAILRKAQEK